MSFIDLCHCTIYIFTFAVILVRIFYVNLFPDLLTDFSRLRSLKVSSSKVGEEAKWTGISKKADIRRKGMMFRVPVPIKIPFAEYSGRLF